MAKANLLVAQSGGPTAVINSTLAGVIHAAYRHGSAIDRVYGAVGAVEGILTESFVDLTNLPADFLDRLRVTPGAALTSARYKLQPGDVARLLDVFARRNVRYFCYIGGNDSMGTVAQLHHAAGDTGAALHVIGAPKTVDNDLAHTDHCPGYGSAARFIAMMIRDTGLDSAAGFRSTPVKIVEIMGRHTGWLTASAALARAGRPDAAPHLIYLPERPLTVERFLDDVARVHEAHGYVVVAVSEGVRHPDGEYLFTTSRAHDAFGHRQLGGVSVMLAHEVQSELGLKARFEKSDTLQRAFAHCASIVDRAEAFMVGQEAVRRAVAGESGVMVTLVRESDAPYRCATGAVDAAAVAGEEKRLPEACIAPNGVDVTAAFLDYARPLIGEALLPYAYLPV